MTYYVTTAWGTKIKGSNIIKRVCEPLFPFNFLQKVLLIKPMLRIDH